MPTADVLPFPSTFKLKDQTLPPKQHVQQKAARRLLESIRQVRLCDRPFKEPVRVSLTLIDDAKIYAPGKANPFASPALATWEDIATFTREA
jgi:hypothetical protein